MEELTNNVNWLAVVLGFVLAFGLGWLWYSPILFGERWAEGVKLNLEKASDMPAAAMITQAIGTFLFAWVVGITFAQGALPVLALIVATFVFLQVSGGYFTQKSAAAIFIDSGFTVAMAAVMLVCQSIV